MDHQHSSTDNFLISNVVTEQGLKQKSRIIPFIYMGRELKRI